MLSFDIFLSYSKNLPRSELDGLHTASPLDWNKILVLFGQRSFNTLDRLTYNFWTEYYSVTKDNPHHAENSYAIYTL